MEILQKIYNKCFFLYNHAKYLETKMIFVKKRKTITRITGMTQVIEVWQQIKRFVYNTYLLNRQQNSINDKLKLRLHT